MVIVLLPCAAIVAITSPEVFALIVGGEGNSPIGDPGWPAGASAIFNTPARVAWWEGPPFGGGQWHAECRGDAKALSDILAKFAKLDVKSKQVVVLDGVGRSFWLKPAKGQAAAKVDWIFMVWTSANWKRMGSGPQAQIDVYAGGNIKWADVIVPRKLKIVDNRLEARGFTLADGVVLEGTVTDLATQKPLTTAKMRLERYEVHPKGSAYIYTTVAQATTDIAGRWVLKNTPPGSHRVIIEADGFVPRALGYVGIDDQPRWQGFDGGLARPAHIAGRVTDAEGRPLVDVEVRIHDARPGSGESYPLLRDCSTKTGADGRFRAEQLPVGRATIYLYKPGYIRPGLGPNITTPADGIELSMIKSARVVVTVDFTGKKRPAEYMVSIAPKGGEAVGKYGGSGNINPKDKMTFDNVPPGEYMIRGRPNPGSANQETEPVMIDLKGGKTAEVKLSAK
jgi:hypothetical protein